MPSSSTRGAREHLELTGRERVAVPLRRSGPDRAEWMTAARRPPAARTPAARSLAGDALGEHDGPVGGTDRRRQPGQRPVLGRSVGQQPAAFEHRLAVGAGDAAALALAPAARTVTASQESLERLGRQHRIGGPAGPASRAIRSVSSS